MPTVPIFACVHIRNLQLFGIPKAYLDLKVEVLNFLARKQQRSDSLFTSLGHEHLGRTRTARPVSHLPGRCPPSKSGLNHCPLLCSSFLQALGGRTPGHSKAFLVLKPDIESLGSWLQAVVLAFLPLAVWAVLFTYYHDMSLPRKELQDTLLRSDVFRYPRALFFTDLDPSILECQDLQ